MGIFLYSSSTENKVCGNNASYNNENGIGLLYVSNNILSGWPRSNIIWIPPIIRANTVIASAARVIGLRHSAWEIRKIAEIRVPAWLIPIKKTKFVSLIATLSSYSSNIIISIMWKNLKKGLPKFAILFQKISFLLISINIH